LKQGFELIGATAVHYCSIGRNNQFTLLTTIKPELGRSFLIFKKKKKTDPGSNEVIV